MPNAPLPDLDPSPANPGLAAHQGFALLKNRLWGRETLASSGTVDLNFQVESTKVINLTGNVTFTFSNLEPGRRLVVKLKADGSTRTLTFPSSPAPVFVGSAAPANLAANKTAILSLDAYGYGADEVVCRWLVQP